MRERRRDVKRGAGRNRPLFCTGPGGPATVGAMRPVHPWRLEPTLRFFAMLPLAMAVAIVVTEVVARAALGAGQPRPAWLLAAGTGLIHALTLALLVPLLRAHRFGLGDAFGLLRPGWPRVWLRAAALTLPALGIAWTLHQGSTWVLERCSIVHDSQAAVNAVRDANRWWERSLLLTFAAITAPILEEVVFRGILWPVVRDCGWRRRGALGVGLLFALIHFNAAALLPLWFLGLFWIWLYERCGDLSAPMVSHALFNGANFLWIVLAAPPPAPSP